MIADAVNVLSTAATALCLYTLIGYALARRLFPEPQLTLPMAPALGWAVGNVVALPVLTVVGFNPQVTWVLAAGAAITSLITVVPSRKTSISKPSQVSRVPWAAFALAAGLAVTPTLAVLPKFAGDGVFLPVTIYDHSKAAIIDDLVRLGLPAGNPFFGDAGHPSVLAYYYLWHFGAAGFALMLGVSGWEADAAMTWFTAFAALTLMMGLAVYVARRPSAAYWVLFLSLAASLRTVLGALVEPEQFEGWLSASTFLQTWLVQASWAPQHLAAALCVVLATLLIARLPHRGGPLAIAALGLCIAAGFESSAWVGGVVFATASLPLAGLLLWVTPSARWPALALRLGFSALIAALLVLPFLRDELAATATRGAGFPIALRPFNVLGFAVADRFRTVLNLPAFWLLLLPIEFPAIYIAGTIAASRELRAGGDKWLVVASLCAVAGAGVMLCAFFASTIGNNDLGWRAPLPGILILTAFAAGLLTDLMARRRWLFGLAAIVPAVLGMVEGGRQVEANALGVHIPSGRLFAGDPAMWSAVRWHTGPAERVANNPLYLADLTSGWPVNISWALLANRRSCFASWDLAIPFVPLPRSEINDLLAMLGRVFAGNATPADLRVLATRLDCTTIVVTPQDGVWQHDNLAASPDYHLVEEQADRWRIYRRVTP